MFLDSKDLINLIRYSDPISADEARTWFVKHNATLVLTHSNVSEFVPVSESDRLRIRAELITLESFPLTYARVGQIRCAEFRNARVALREHTAYVAPDIFVSTFWRTFWPEPGGGLNVVLTRQLERMVGLRLWEQVFVLWSNAANFVNAPADTAAVQRMLTTLRSAAKPRRARFRDELRHAAESCGDSDEVPPELPSWINADPNRCAGWRLYFEVIQAWLRNRTDCAKDGDVNDLTHMFAVPYVDFMTLDVRFVEYCRQASDELQRYDSSVNYAARVFPSFAALCAALP